MEKEDTFVFNGLVSRNSDSREIIVFGNTYAHVYNEQDKTFKVLE